ncbi:Syo1p [Sugiyamaella lignohabitans]|uniref:Syo1p n=1 Tax=Sugiyamaella lignohabitans TaxID=796027 RepID=A0A167FHB7_9ASCO|nr:Syo1p [Sugiyamaella lignohabitans]ANB15298.1 Syo1p [Sugiyamaella lignohabitans]
MAKAKRSKKSSLARKAAGPISKNDQKDERLRQEKIMPLIAKLSYPSTSDRAMAVSAIISMCEDPKLRSLLLKEKLVQTIMSQSLTDNSEEIVAEAYGLLRNLVAEEGYDVAIFLYRQDILTAIEASLAKIDTLLNGTEAIVQMIGEQRNLAYEYFENVIGLVASIASADEEIFEAVDKRLSQLGKFVSEKLALVLSVTVSGPKTKPVKVPSSLIDSLLELVYVLSESNSNFINQFNRDLIEEIIKNSESKVSKVYANGFKYNAYVESKVTLSKQKNQKKLPTPTSNSNDQEVGDILSSLINIISPIDITSVRDHLRPVVENTEPSQLNESSKNAVAARSSINAIQVAIELITAIAETMEVDPSIIYTEKDLSQLELGESDGMDEDISDEAYFEQSISQNAKPEEDLGQFDDIEIDGRESDSVADSSVFFLNEKVVPLCVRYLSIPELCSRSMAALNNVCWTLQSKIPMNNNEWKTHAEQLWSNLATETYLNASEVEIVIGCVGVLGAVATAFKGQVPVEINNHSLVSTISKMCIDLKPSTPEDEYLELATRVVVLFTVLGKVQSRHGVTSEVSAFFSEIIKTPLSTPAPLLFETINAIFDLFGDASYDYDEPVFVDANWVDKLKQALPQVRQAAKRIDRKKDPELRAIGDEAALNLTRFIDYKVKERL